VSTAIGSLKKAAMVLAAWATAPSRGETRVTRGGRASRTSVTTISSVTVALPPVSDARACSVKLERSRSSGAVKRCSNGKLPSVATFTPSSRNSTLRTWTSSATSAEMRTICPSSAAPRAKLERRLIVGGTPATSAAR
jgi:hypothetical protein